MLLDQNENILIKRGNWIGTLWSITGCTKNALHLLELPEVSAIVSPNISKTVILLKKLFSLKEENKSRNKVFFPPMNFEVSRLDRFLLCFCFLYIKTMCVPGEMTASVKIKINMILASISFSGFDRGRDVFNGDHRLWV